MALRWTAAGMLQAERQFRKIVGYKQLARFVITIERDLEAAEQTTKEAATLITASTTPGPPSPKFHDERDILCSPLRQAHPSIPTTSTARGRARFERQGFGTCPCTRCATRPSRS